MNGIQKMIREVNTKVVKMNIEKANSNPNQNQNLFLGIKNPLRRNKKNQKYPRI